MIYMPRVAKAAALSIIEGNPNNKTKKELYKRKRNEKKMQLSDDKLIAPSWLDPGAKKDFNFLVSLLKESKVVNNADLTQLAIYCDTLYDYKAYKRAVKKYGKLINGKINPFIREKRNAAQLLDKIGNEFGLSPTARNSIAINLPEENDSDDNEDF